MDLGLANARALVTGGSQGIGRAIAAALVAEGARVAICARSADEVTTAAQGLARSVEGGADVHAVVADVAVPDGAEGAVAAAVAQLGGLDLLVGNVGGAQGGGLEDSSAEDWAATFELNVGHCVRALRAALPALRASDRAAALFISSISGRKPAPRAQYGAAKAATSYAAAALARELAPERIRVNALSPGVDPVPGRWLGPAAPSRSRALRGVRGARPAVGPPGHRRGGRRTPQPSCSRRAPAGSTAPTSPSTAPRAGPAPAAGEGRQRLVTCVGGPTGTVR